MSTAGDDTIGSQKEVLKTHKMMMNSPQYPFGHTSNDLLFSLEQENSRKALNYEIVAQSVEEVQDIQNAPAVSMGPYLVDSGQEQLLTTISIYAQRREVRAQVRLLYMNAVALRIESDGQAANRDRRAASSPKNGTAGLRGSIQRIEPFH